MSSGSDYQARSKFTSLRHISEFLAGCLKTDKIYNAEDIAALFSSLFEKSHQEFRDTYQACLGRLPESAVLPRHYAGPQEAGRHLADCLECAEFLSNFPSLVAQAYPEARRIIYIHIPKTAGTDIKTKLRKRHDFFWDFFWGIPFWYRYDLENSSTFALLAALGRGGGKSLVFAGHSTLRDIEKKYLIRSHDKIFTVIRDPKAMIVSSLNYIFTVILAAPDREDSLVFAQWLRSVNFEPPRSPDEIGMAMIEALALSTGFREENKAIISRYVSSTGHTADAIGSAIRANIEFVDIRHLSAYARNDLEVVLSSEARENVSMKFINDFAEFSVMVKSILLTEVIGGDLALYNTLLENMGEDGVLRPMRDLV